MSLKNKRVVRQYSRTTPAGFTISQLVEQERIAPIQEMSKPAKKIHNLKGLAGQPITFFAFTYTHNHKKSENVKYNLNPEVYTPVFDLLRKKGRVIDYVFETQPVSGALHIHGYALLPKGTRYTSLVVKGFNSHWKIVDDLEGWIKYMDKDQNLRSIGEHVEDNGADVFEESTDAEDDDEPIDEVPKYNLFVNSLYKKQGHKKVIKIDT